VTENEYAQRAAVRSIDLLGVVRSIAYVVTKLVYAERRRPLMKHSMAVWADRDKISDGIDSVALASLGQRPRVVNVDVADAQLTEACCEIGNRKRGKLDRSELCMPCEPLDRAHMHLLWCGGVRLPRSAPALLSLLQNELVSSRVTRGSRAKCFPAWLRLPAEW
jgi:hypothetical protein